VASCGYLQAGTDLLPDDRIWLLIFILSAASGFDGAGRCIRRIRSRPGSAVPAKSGCSKIDVPFIIFGRYGTICADGSFGGASQFAGQTGKAPMAESISMSVSGELRRDARIIGLLFAS
jgi:hypothetical protein